MNGEIEGVPYTPRTKEQRYQLLLEAARDRCHGHVGATTAMLNRKVEALGMTIAECADTESHYFKAIREIRST